MRPVTHRRLTRVNSSAAGSWHGAGQSHFSLQELEVVNSLPSRQVSPGGSFLI